MAIDRAATARGALAGGVAATVWVLQQPLDRRVFGVPSDDAELLGKAFTRRRGWRPLGMALHVLNGAAFGAVYATLAPRVPLPSWARGPAAGVAEHLASWPLLGLVERVHPARDELPPLSGSPAAFAQGAWRHLLFGTVLGELERRLNPPTDADVPAFEAVVSSNGHGDLAAAAGVAR